MKMKYSMLDTIKLATWLLKVNHGEYLQLTHFILFL